MKIPQRLFGSVLAPVAALVVAAPAWAQEPRITFPTEGQDVRGEITITFEGVPEGGYAMVYLDPDTPEGRAPLTATSEGRYSLNTFLDAINRVRLGEGPHKLRIVAVNAQGRRSGQAEVNFNIANTKVDITQEGVRLVHWTPQDRIINEVKRYRIFAESNATVEEPSTGGGGDAGGFGGSSGGGYSAAGASGGGAGVSSDNGASLDFNLSALVRRVVRDVNMIDGSANIRAVVDRAFQRSRASETGDGSSSGSGGGQGGGAAAAAPGQKPPFGPWKPAVETGQYYVKMIQPTGSEINATRKAPTIALGDLLPTFPQGEVRPGSTWETTMTMIGELAERSPINIRNAPMTFTAFEVMATPAGMQRRAAKLETRFQLPQPQALELAKKLESKRGSSQGGGGGEGSSEGGSLGGSSRGGYPSGLGGAGGGMAEPEIKNARSRVSRVLWFDIAKRQVLRSEDVVDTYYEVENAQAGVGGAGGSGSGYPGGAGGQSQAPAEPTKVSYNQRITTWLDDTVPPPTDQFTAGAGTAHSRDRVQDPDIARVTRTRP
jgi:hypothetical protein